MATRVFRDDDRRALDAEYNNRQKVKDAADYLERYASESARARAELACRRGRPSTCSSTAATGTGITQ